ncbi:MAG: cytochrome c biogenesis protein ResB [bacterium]
MTVILASEKSSAISAVGNRLSSIRLTIGLCIVLAAVSVLGTVIPQDAPPEQYQALYGATGARILSGLGLLDLYHSAGFILLLALLAVNLAACTLHRIRGVWRSLRGPSSLPRDLELSEWKHRDTLRLRGDREEIERALDRLLPKIFGKPMRAGTADAAAGKRVLRLERNRFARLGPYVAHVSLLIILLGGLTGALFGFKGSMVLREGEESSKVWLQNGGRSVDLPFRVRCERFVVESYPNGSPKEFRSEVTLLGDGGEKQAQGSIRVNHPLSHNGITFYQSTYGSVPELSLQVEHPDAGEHTVIQAELNVPFVLPGKQGERARVVRFQEDLIIPPEMARVTSFPGGSLGPAVQIEIFDEQGFHEPFWIFQNFPEMDRKRATPYHFRLSGFRLLPYTGLQVARDPGAVLVWIGCTLLVAGFLVSLLMDHEIVWAIREIEGKDRVKVQLAGRAVRHPLGYAGRFERRKSRLRKRLSHWL